MMVVVLVILIVAAAAALHQSGDTHSEMFVASSKSTPQRRTCPVSTKPADQVAELYKYIRALPPKNQDQLYDAWSVRRDGESSVFMKDQRPMEGPQPLPEQEMVATKQ